MNVRLMFAIVDYNTIHEINRNKRKIDRPTDVLSFQMLDYEVAGDFSMAEDDISNFNPDSGELILGDIVISYDKVIEQAAEYNHSRKRELAFLVAHSMLHLFGFDHMVDDERIEMEEKQNIITKIIWGLQEKTSMETYKKKCKRKKKRGD